MTDTSVIYIMYLQWYMLYNFMYILEWLVFNRKYVFRLWWSILHIISCKIPTFQLYKFLHEIFPIKNTHYNYVSTIHNGDNLWNAQHIIIFLIFACNRIIITLNLTSSRLPSVMKKVKLLLSGTTSAWSLSRPSLSNSSPSTSMSGNSIILKHSRVPGWEPPINVTELMIMVKSVDSVEEYWNMSHVSIWAIIMLVK